MRPTSSPSHCAECARLLREPEANSTALRCMPKGRRRLEGSECTDEGDGDASVTYVILRAARRTSGCRLPIRRAAAGARSKPTMSRRVLPLALVLALAATAGGRLAATRGGSSEDAGIHPAAVPDWFLPIADAYDRDPAITPATDFAALYDARPATSARLTVSRGGRNPKRVGTQGVARTSPTSHRGSR